MAKSLDMVVIGIYALAAGVIGTGVGVAVGSDTPLGWATAREQQHKLHQLRLSAILKMFSWLRIIKYGLSFQAHIVRA